ncbi:MAG: preprotein translocase subunit YajC [Gammaproteobacteria bacterium]|nr:preprotein translocase subunit YajC [Gammaproteobacteria bacterium]
MNFFISDAIAEGTAQATQQGDPIMGLLLPIGLVVLFYFFLIRPQSKRAKEHRAMVEAIGKGDEVVTAGGILGKVVEVKDNFIGVEIATDTVVYVQKSLVSTLMPKGTIKDLK